MFAPILQDLQADPGRYLGESGGRGLLALPAFERSPWQSLQAAWRLLSRDLGIAADLRGLAEAGEAGAKVQVAYTIVPPGRVRRIAFSRRARCTERAPEQWARPSLT